MYLLVDGFCAQAMLTSAMLVLHLLHGITILHTSNGKRNYFIKKSYIRTTLANLTQSLATLLSLPPTAETLANNTFPLGCMEDTSQQKFMGDIPQTPERTHRIILTYPCRELH